MKKEIAVDIMHAVVTTNGNIPDSSIEQITDDVENIGITFLGYLHKTYKNLKTGSCL